MTRLWHKIIALTVFRQKNTLPETPGVYFFLDIEKQLLYIGKASSLRERVKSYFSQDIAETRGPKIARMLEQVSFVAYRQTDSVLEALILESALINTHQPPYNTDAKDDKSYQYVVITREKFPRVLMVRGRNLMQEQSDTSYQYVFGPFPSGSAVREALGIIRKLFPYRDKCIPVAEKHQKPAQKPRPCFSAQIGLCPGVCTGAVSAREYRRTLQHIRLFFEGRKKTLITKLEREMRREAQQLHFEKAGALKKTLFGLRHIQDATLLKDDGRLQLYAGEEAMRIEAYDVAHLGGDASVGVMVVVHNGLPEQASYRKFILRGKHNGDDLTALAEILTRRLKRKEWPLPNLIVIDGGIPQLRTAQEILARSGVLSRQSIAVVGVVKDAKHQPKRCIGDVESIQHHHGEILLANSIAHRFAITFHRKRRAQEWL